MQCYASGVEYLVDFARSLWSALGSTVDIRLVGGLAVRLHVGSLARQTRDIDVVAMNEEAAHAITVHLQNAGFVVGGTVPWQRAVRTSNPRLIIDVLKHPLVDPRTFQEVSLARDPSFVEVAGTRLSVASVDDLARLKLLAARDQDLVDLVSLAARRTVCAAAIAGAAAADDAERALSAGAAVARRLLATGELAEIAAEALGRPIDAGVLAQFRSLLDDLEKEGI
jgi:hypothetical protein